MVTQVDLVLQNTGASGNLKYEFFPGGKVEISCGLSSLSRAPLEFAEKVSNAEHRRNI
jgi:hypothetical protein